MNSVFIFYNFLRFLRLLNFGSKVFDNSFLRRNDKWAAWKIVKSGRKEDFFTSRKSIKLEVLVRVIICLALTAVELVGLGVVGRDKTALGAIHRPVADRARLAARADDDSSANPVDDHGHPSEVGTVTVNVPKRNLSFSCLMLEATFRRLGVACSSRACRHSCCSFASCWSHCTPGAQLRRSSSLPRTARRRRRRRSHRRPAWSFFWPRRFRLLKMLMRNCKMLLWWLTWIGSFIRRNEICALHACESG